MLSTNLSVLDPLHLRGAYPGASALGGVGLVLDPLCLQGVYTRKTKQALGGEWV